MRNKEHRRKKRHGHLRRSLTGSPERPRLCIHRSNKNLYVQIVDDEAQNTLYAFSTGDKEFSESNPGAGKVERAKKLGAFYAAKIKDKGIKKIAFDRGGYRFHGRIKALADSLREGGLEF